MVSVIVPCFSNQLGLLTLCESLICQTYSHFEVIVIDDGSFPLLTLPTLDSRFRIFHHQENRGPAFARNLGIHKANGDILAFTDSDCIVSADWLEKIVEKFKDNLLNVLCGGVFIRTKSRLGSFIAQLGYPAGGNLGFPYMWHVSHQNKTHHLSSCNFAVRSKFLRETQLNFDETFPFPGGEDNLFSQRIIELGESITYDPNLRIEHEEVKSIQDFIRWHFRRGRGIHYLKKSNFNLNRTYRWRIKSFISCLDQQSLSSKIILTMLFVIQIGTYFMGRFFEKVISFKKSESRNLEFQI